MKRVLFLLLFCFHLHAAGPITHTHIGYKWLEKHPQFEEMPFLNGTLFPDIRYLGVINREQTHEKGVTIQKILTSKTPFQAGMRLHVYLDDVREDFVIKQNIYPHLPKKYTAKHAILLKLIEDEILFHKRNYQALIAYLTHYKPQDNLFGISAYDLASWQLILISCHTQPPSQLLKQMEYTKKTLFGIPSEWLEEWSHYIEHSAKNPFFTSHVEALIKHVSATF